MNKRTVLCFLVFAMCVFCGSVPTSTFAQGKLLAQQVFRKHNRTLQRADVQEVLPQVLEGLKAPETQAHLNPRTINAVVANPDILLFFIPDIEPRFVALLKRDQELKNFLRDPLVQRLLQSPAAIDALADLLEVDAELPNLDVDQIVARAMPSVVWIYNVDEDTQGSGVLIDEERRLIATNAHITESSRWVFACFPVPDRDGELVGERAYYLQNYESLQKTDYATWGRVIAEDFNRDLAIIQLDSLPRTAREIEHDFGIDLSRKIKKGDPVHILGNPGKLDLWRWTVGLFHADTGQWLQINADVYGGNSGGPVLNGRGQLIGIISLSDRRTKTWAVPARYVKVLLSKIGPKHTFRIKNNTRFTVPYWIKWSNNHEWKRQSLNSGRSLYYWWRGEVVPWGYPKIQFDEDEFAGDGRFTPRIRNLTTFLRYFGPGYRNHITPDDAYTYSFSYNPWTRRIILSPDTAAAPALSKSVPEENALFANYPNPFNPETWIPYQLAKPAEVKVAIYAADGTLVRTLSLGHQPAGVYRSKGRAAYWDGTNAQGEPVASGVYFYTLKVSGEFTATRKMLIQK